MNTHPPVQATSCRRPVQGLGSTAEVSTQLSDIQDALGEVNAGIAQIETQLTALANEFEQQADEIKGLVIAQTAQSAMNTLDSWYGDVGVNNYAYFTSLYKNPPADPTLAEQRLSDFEETLLNPASGVMKAIKDIYTAIIPTGAPNSGLLVQWTNAMCVGALSDTEMMDAYLAAEYYFSQLIVHQMQGVQLLCEANNAQDGVPDGSSTNGYHANQFLVQTWFPWLRDEIDNYLTNVSRLVLSNAKSVNSFTPDLISDGTLESILARANFVWCSLQEQIDVFADGAGTGDPQKTYGLQSLVIYPTALATHSGSMYATRPNGLVDYKSVSTEDTYTVGGPKAAVFNTGTPATLDIGSSYTLRRLNWGGAPVVLYPGKPFTIHDFTRNSIGSQYYDHGDVTLAYVNTDYTTATGPGDGVILYGCKVVAYQYYSGTENDFTWYRPRSLGGGWAVTSTDSPFSGWLQVSNNPDGNSQVLFPSQAIDMKRSLPSGQMAWTYEMGLPQFTYIGPAGAGLGFELWSSNGEDTSSILADGLISSDRGGNGGWAVTFALRDGAGKEIKSASMTSTTKGSTSLTGVSLTNGQMYGFFGTNHADFKASSSGQYTLYMLSQFDFNHIDVSIQ